MKTTFKNIAILIVSFIAFSFTYSAIISKTVNTKASKITWKGYKITGSHTGQITIKSGDLIFNDDKLTGGNFVIDMTSIDVTDLEGDYKNKLEGHLKSDDFFGVNKFPTASLSFTNVKQTGKNAYDITGNIKIKGVSKSVNFALSVYGNKATANLKLDRTEFGIRYGSSSFFDGLKDKAIYDEFDLVVDLEF